MNNNKYILTIFIFLLTKQIAAQTDTFDRAHLRTEVTVNDKRINLLRQLKKLLLENQSEFNKLDTTYTFNYQYFTKINSSINIDSSSGYFTAKYNGYKFPIKLFDFSNPTLLQFHYHYENDYKDILDKEIYYNGISEVLYSYDIISAVNYHIKKWDVSKWILEHSLPLIAVRYIRFTEPISYM